MGEEKLKRSRSRRTLRSGVLARQLATFALIGAAGVLLGFQGKPRSASTVDWRHYEGDAGAAHYSPLTQITPANVARLSVAWRYDLGSGTSVANPLIVDGIAYLIGGGGTIVALDAASGNQLWSLPDAAPGNRGLALWKSADGAEKRIFYTAGKRLHAIDAATGKVITSFDVDLRVGLGRPPAQIGQIQSRSPGRVFGDLIIVGSAPGEDYTAAAGDIRAYNVRTGILAWTFKTIPDASDPAALATWGANPRAEHGGANSWTGLALDERRGIVFAVTGSSTYDFWGVDRPGANLYSDCIIALDARTGRRLWHFQTVHHDLWDYDLAASPVLLTIRRGGRRVDAVAVAAKTGMVFVFDRLTGKPLYPIEERPVPQGGMPGELISPTQPFSTLEPFVRQRFGVEDLDPALPPAEAQAFAARLRAARNEGIFTPPSERETVEMPGSNGGANWGGSAADPRHGLFFAFGFDVPAIIQLRKTNPANSGGVGATAQARGQDIYSRNCSGCHGADRAGQGSFPSLIGITGRVSPEIVTEIIHQGRAPMPAFPQIVGAGMDDLMAFLTNGAAKGADASATASPPPPTVARWRTEYGYLFSAARNPPIRPPWSSLSAYDLNSGKRLWRIPLGNDPNYPIKGPETGIGLNKLGIVVTGGGLIFAATSRDHTLRAIDPRTGAVLWRTTLPAASSGTPSTYAVNGRQYLLVPVASSGEKNPREQQGVAPARNSYVAYALPETMRP
ncbi:MAG TPA: PQQ-binding-like beta-propeller repeat protein [Sphingomonas sp.]|nr:PQQ-binding-like beta-propeller repeat protein [Sphingomonas sp.]